MDSGTYRGAGIWAFITTEWLEQAAEVFCKRGPMQHVFTGGWDNQKSRDGVQRLANNELLDRTEELPSTHRLQAIINFGYIGSARRKVFRFEFS